MDNNKEMTIKHHDLDKLNIELNILSALLGKGLRFGELVDASDVSEFTVQKYLKVLEKEEGLVEHTYLKDKRASGYKLTQKGKVRIDVILGVLKTIVKETEKLIKQKG